MKKPSDLAADAASVMTELAEDALTAQEAVVLAQDLFQKVLAAQKKTSIPGGSK